MTSGRRLSFRVSNYNHWLTDGVGTGATAGSMAESRRAGTLIPDRVTAHRASRNELLR